MNRSIAIAISIFALLSLYMLTGLVGCGKKEASTESNGNKTIKAVITVSVREVSTENLFRKVRITAKTVPSRSVDLKAETAGTISSLGARRGSQLSKGDMIAQIELNNRKEKLAQAKAGLSQAQFEYDAATRLKEQDLRSASQVAQALSALRGAEQAVSSIELDIKFTRIVAPFDGILQDRMVEVGDYLGIGDSIARIIDIDPIVVEGEVTEDQVGVLKVGEEGSARLPDGRVIEGVIRYVASEASAESRTFLVEMEVPNPDLKIHAGVTASVEIKTEEVRAIRITNDLLAITDDGRVGIKVVDDENRVRFIQADNRELGPDNIWIMDLPPTIRLITNGQGFTREGDLVEVVLESDEG